MGKQFIPKVPKIFRHSSDIARFRPSRVFPRNRILQNPPSVAGTCGGCSACAGSYYHCFKCEPRHIDSVDSLTFRPELRSKSRLLRFID